MDGREVTDFIVAQTRLATTPLVPEIRLHLATEITPIWQATEDWLNQRNIAPPFWAFSWAGGQALARYVLDHPELVRGRRILDFAAGAGVAAIACMKAGAKSVTAVEIDAVAAAAMRLNAMANAVDIAVLTDDIVGWDLADTDLLIAGDVCYEKAMAERVICWLRRLAGQGVEVWLGDPGRTYFPQTGIEKRACFEVPVTRELEDRDIRTTEIVRLCAG